MKIFWIGYKILVFSFIVLFTEPFINFNSFSPEFKKEKASDFPLFDLQAENQACLYPDGTKDPEFLKSKSKWVDSVLQTLSIDEKIGQMIMMGAYSNMGSEHQRSIENLIKKYKIGGLIFFQGSPVRQAQLTNYYQGISKIPLLIAMDAEWGINMRLDSTVSFPRQMMMGAIQDDQLIYDFGIEVGRQFNRMGMHINFAPVADINNNPRNPVINSRSFGEHRINVAEKTLAYMIGMQDRNIIATAKHFPGHGDTESDSHETLPVINHDLARLDSLELFPFKYLVDNGLAAVMVAHLHVPALDSSANIASSMSHKIISDLLKKKMQFKGLVFTDALGMQGVSAYNSSGEIALKAFKAGTDMLLMPPDIESAVYSLKNALSKGLITEKEIDERCFKILQAKKWVGLDNNKPVIMDNLIEDLNNEEANFVNQKIVESSITLVENKNNIIPIKNIDSISVASVSIGSGKPGKFQSTLSLYDDVIHFSIDKKADAATYRALLGKLSGFDLVILGFHKSNHSPSSFGMTETSFWFAHELTKYTKVIIDVFASPYVLTRFKRDDFEGIIVSYEDTEVSQDFSAQLIYGGITARGKLPVSGGKNYPARTGLTGEKIRLKYALPKEVKIDEKKLKKIDSIILSAIDQHAFPGCQILAAKSGVVFYNKSYGYQTYEKKNSVSDYDLYDLASITKIAATLPIIMKLYEDGKLKLDDRLANYFPEFNTPEKKNINIKQVLAHQAGFISWIPFYLRTYQPLSDSSYILNPLIYQPDSDSVFTLHVAEGMYMNKLYVDTMYKRIFNAPVRKKPRYRYSDLGFYLFYRMISEKMKIDFEQYLNSQFYKSIGLSTFCFNPVEKFPVERIVPTENDKKFRKQLIQGYVHDYGAAMMGGIGGHAGLFSNANDLAKLMQMYLQKGEYGGIKYFDPGTIEIFSSNAYSKTKNRRALGFDKPGLDKKSPVSKLASPLSYGHKGFSGTMVWVDPEEQFIFVFLSNRIHPNVENNLLNDLKVRTKVHDVFYKSFN